MLPENTFPVTGGIMQTEEVVPRAQSTGIDGSLTDSTTFEHSLHRSPLLQSPLPSSILMAVKQEPQEDDERSRDTNALSQQADAEPALSPVDAGHFVLHHGQDAGLHHQSQGTEVTAGPTGHDNSGRARSSRRRRKSRWKLKFHHQALPPEYLDHYEATLAQEALNSSPNHTNESTIPSPAPTTSTSTSGSTPSPVSDVQGWLHRIAAMQQELYPRVVASNEPLPLGAAPYRRSVITSTANSHPAGTNHKNHHHSHQQNNYNAQVAQHHQIQQQQPTPRPPMKYSDLPYMGEITLDNSKPRRGRKPKKADICHLIYKNYGTILPGTPGHEERKQQQQQHQQQQQQQHVSKERLEVAREQIQHHPTFQRTDIQNRISSLLEKRLTQESRKSLATMAENHREQDEPLNLCIKDLNQLKIRILRKHGNVYESGNVKSEVSSDTDEVECLGTAYSSPLDTTRSTEIANMSNNNSLVAINNNNNNEPLASPNNSGFVYWPNAGVLIHPMALQSQFLYYQKMAQNEKSVVRLNDVTSKEQKIVPKSIYTMLERSKSPTALSTETPTQQPTPLQSPPSPRPKRNAPISHQIAPMKRKRSAIFIPPLPTENNNNPPTEVSICKFKFTGGAKPSLQEKKSLSVDSDGTFRYYTGTGDKSMRGYSVFPRESLQQPAGQAGTSAGAFLSATGERIPPPAIQCQRTTNATVAVTAAENDIRRKRKTRKSLQREKLEQTFKEKGFLIQTQQLESAEGATYCKFRQLRKFTRYLFRSWKDYLPGDVCDLSATANGHRVIDPDAITEGQHPIVDSTVPLAGIIDMPNNAELEQHRTRPLT